MRSIAIVCVCVSLLGCGQEFAVGLFASETAGGGPSDAAGAGGFGDEGGGGGVAATGSGGATVASSSTSGGDGAGGAVSSGGGAATTASGGGESSSASSGSGGDGGAGSGAGGGEAVACAHTPCAAGEPLDPACDPVVAKVCVDGYGYCCTDWWDAFCMAQYFYTFAPGGGGCPLAANTCPHSLCEEGGPLPGGANDACSQAVASLCTTPDAVKCCTTAWDEFCIVAVQKNCKGPGCTCQ